MSHELIDRRNQIEPRESLNKSNSLRSALKEFVKAIEPYSQDGQVLPIYIFGSLGRRLAMANVSNWEGYEIAITKELRLRPRKNVRGNWDIDIAIPKNSIPWAILTSTARKISENGDKVEIDPHYLDNSTENDFFLSKNTQRISHSTYNFEMVEINLNIGDDPSPIKTLDRWSHLFYLLSARKLRARDLTEISLLTQYMTTHNDFTDKTKIKLALEIIKRNKSLRSLKNLVRWPYELVVPYKIRWKVAEIRKKAPMSQFNFNSSDPIYF